MIFNTNFKSLMLNSLLNDLNSSGYDGDGFKYGGLVLYSGTIPTVTEYNADWSSKYYATGTEFGTDVLTVYGRVGTGRNVVNMVSLDHDTDGNFTLDVNYINDMDVNYVRDGVATWAAYFPHMNNSANATTTNSNNSARWFLCTVSDGTGNGIVQLDNTTIIGEAPILSSFGFSFSAGGE